MKKETTQGYLFLAGYGSKRAIVWTDSDFFGISSGFRRRQTGFYHK